MSLDPESLLGIKSAVLKAAVAGTMLGVLWRREFTLAEALSSAAAGFGSAMWIAPALLVHAPSWLQHEDTRAGIIFSFGMAGIHVFALVSNHGPALLRRLVRSRLMLDTDDTGKPKGGAS
jgi:hypothetical protein